MAGANQAIVVDGVDAERALWSQGKQARFMGDSRSNGATGRARPTRRVAGVVGSSRHGVSGVMSCVASVFACALLVASPCGAQHRHRRNHPPSQGHPGAVGDDGSTEARAHFDRGVALAERQRWDEALDAFQRAASIERRPSTLFNIAHALTRLGRPRDALVALDAYLATPDADVERVRRARSMREDAVRAAASAARREPSEQAAPSRPEITSAQALRAFERGREALVARRNDDAAAAFQEAATLEPSPGTWRWLGSTLRSMARYTEAIAAYERFLAAPTVGATAQNLAEVSEAIDEMRRRQATLTISARPLNATITVDGRTLAVAPSGLRLDPGAHVVGASLEGFVEAHRELTLVAGTQGVVEFDLRPRSSARLIVNATVPSAAILVDGEVVGRGHIDRALESGSHVVLVRAEGYEAFERTLRFGLVGVTRLEATLTRPGLPRWVLPVSIVGGALVAGGAVTAVVLATRQSDPTINPGWGEIRESLRWSP
jgi:tetratricopeptide (TPR) repeat protein